MIKPAPKIDRRTAADIAQQVQDLLKVYLKDDTPDLSESDKGISNALIGIFARFAEIIIQRLNKVPDQNLLAFLNLLGASRLPPQPARVPLTFSLTAGSVTDAVVPAGTQVAAPPGKGEQDPVIFETERELVVTAAKLESIFVRDPELDKYANYSNLKDSEIASGFPIFDGDKPIAHIFYLGHDQLFGYDNLHKLSLIFELEKQIQNPIARNIQWEIWDGFQGQKLTKESDSTNNLTQNGSVVFTIRNSSFTQKTVNKSTNRWLRCRLQTPITAALLQQLPNIKNVTITAEVKQDNVNLEAALTNVTPIDLNKGFYPFGEKPKFDDTFYLASPGAFSQLNSQVTLTINARDLSAQLKAKEEAITLKLVWEFYDGKKWEKVGYSSLTKNAGENQEITGTYESETGFNFRDDTWAFTKLGTVKFTLASLPEKATVNGVDNYWIRVRIFEGNYGEEARYQPDIDAPGGYRLIPASFTPPSISSIAVSYTLTREGESPQEILTYNDFVYQPVDKQVTTSFKPFAATKDDNKTLYLGFTLSANRKFPNQPLSLYFSPSTIFYGTQPDFPSPTSSPRLIWEYFNTQKTWTKLIVEDETEAFTSPGIVRILPPADITKKIEFDREQYWLRVQFESGVYKFNPKLKFILLNTTIAAQTVTIRNEILGSSDTTERQVFRTTHFPVIQGQYLEVREPEMPSETEEKGDNAVTVIKNTTGQIQEIWVRWQEVTDFYGSKPRDRHYILDHITGEIRFGNGINGLIPPLGTGNIRMTRYQTGGGTRGNRDPGTIIQLKTTVPYIDKVTNPEATTGGADAESLESLLERAPRQLRHNKRAVTLEDYEDLALLASPEVARAKCIPLLNLLQNPLEVQNSGDQIPKAAGDVSVIIVPYTTATQPIPNVELMNHVRNYLLDHSTPTANISVVGPLYISMNVEAEIVLTSLEGASGILQGVEQKIANFLHPLTGGLSGKGWTFGRKPYASDFYALIEAIPGVNYVRTLKLTSSPQGEELEKISNTNRFLVSSGKHIINLY